MATECGDSIPEGIHRDKLSGRTIRRLYPAEGLAFLFFLECQGGGKLRRCDYRRVTLPD